MSAYLHTVCVYVAILLRANVMPTDVRLFFRFCAQGALSKERELTLARTTAQEVRASRAIHIADALALFRILASNICMLYITLLQSIWECEADID